MRRPSFLGNIVGAVALLSWAGCSTLQPTANEDAALTGQVRSQQEGQWKAW
jgi:hypothetical protein